MSDEKPMGQVIQIDEARIRDHLGEMVRGTVEQTLTHCSMLRPTGFAVLALSAQRGPARYSRRQLVRCRPAPATSTSRSRSYAARPSRRRSLNATGGVRARSRER